MIHPRLLVNTPAQSSVPRCFVLESESIGICGVFCTSCTCLPDFCIPLYHKQTSRNRSQILVLGSEFGELRKMYTLNRDSCSSLHTIKGKDTSFTENRHKSGMFGLLATTLNRGVAYHTNISKSEAWPPYNKWKVTSMYLHAARQPRTQDNFISSKLEKTRETQLFFVTWWFSFREVVFHHEETQ